jgi:2-methylaconitate cis-trans-isomerase PrpF
VFVNAEEIGYSGTELREAINTDPKQLERFEQIRIAGALRMGLIKTPEEAQTRQHTPKIAFVAPPKDYVASSGKQIAVGDIDLLVRALSMGKLHHAMMGTCAVAIGTAAAIPGTWSTWPPVAASARRCASAIRRAPCAWVPRRGRKTASGR